MYIYCRKVDPFQGPRVELLSNTWKWTVWGDTCRQKAKNFIGNEHPGGEQQGKGTQENCSATWLAVSGFTVTGLVSGLSLAIHLAWPKFPLTQSPSWWPVPLSAKMDSSVRLLDSWQDTPSPPSSFWPSQILQVSFGEQHRVLYGNLLLWDNSGKQILLCLA